MSKVSVSQHFFKVNKSDLKYGLGEAVLLAYVAEFESRKLTCFASREHIANELQISETRVQDMIKRLSKAGAILVNYHGRKRVLNTNPARSKGSESDQSRDRNSTNRGIGFQPDRDRNSTSKGIGKRSHEGSESNPMRDRNPIHTKIYTTYIDNTKIYKKDNLQSIPRLREAEPFEEEEILDKDGWPERF